MTPRALIHICPCCQWSLWSPSSSSFLISAFRWLMFSLLAFSLSFSSAISWLVRFFAVSIFSLVFCSSSLTADTGRQTHISMMAVVVTMLSFSTEARTGFHLYQSWSKCENLCLLCLVFLCSVCVCVCTYTLSRACMLPAWVVLMWSGAAASWL